MPSSVLKKKVSSNGEELPETSATDAEQILLEVAETDQLDELRRILIQPNEVSDVLPTAVVQSSNTDNQLAEATLPIVEENIRESVKRNPEKLAEALFPVIGPAIRKAIAEALSTMVQSLNQTLEHSVSPQGLRWRMEAWRTGKQFSEVVLLNTLLYRVEQVFLIHKETGLLLQHASVNADENQEADMVSAMLTAIQDFAQDSFKQSEQATLDALQLNEFSIWIERSPDLILAAVIRGNAPLNLRQTFDEAIEQIQFTQKFELTKFKGDAEPFEKTRPVLQECLQMQTGETKESKILKPTHILGGILGIVLLVFGFFYVRDAWRWSNFVSRLKSEQGIVVTDAERGWFTHSVAGLRDPLAINPENILAEYSFEKEDVKQNWKIFQDASPPFVVQRAEKLLNPPNTIKLSFENGTLTAIGTASGEWFTEAKKLAPALAGVSEFRIGQDSLESLKNKIEAQNIAFSCNTTDFAENQDLTNAANDIENLSNLAVAAQKKLQIEIRGHASDSGTTEINDKISQGRAEKVLSELLKSESLRGLQKSNPAILKSVGLGAEQSSADCKVTFKVTLE